MARRWWCLVLLLLGSVAEAQRVSGDVTNMSGVPIPGVVIQLVDSGSVTVARTLTDEHGAFRLVAPAAGSYRLRTLRVGFTPYASPAFAIGSNEEVSRSLTLRSIAALLDTVHVSRNAVCRSSADASSATFALWEQARAALTAASVSLDDRSIVSTIVSFRRILDPKSHQPIRESLMSGADSTGTVWSTAPMDSLRTVGYVVVSGDTSVFNAPGLDMLASDAFIEDHCFRITEGPDPRTIGISFEPTSDRRRISEIAGTLVLDRSTSELRSADFHYVNSDRVPGASQSGGSMEFARMPNDAWVIARWSIRMPLLERRGRRISTSRFTVAALQEDGGELAVSRRGQQTLWVHTPVALTGTVIDSSTSKPSSGARVALLDTEKHAVADAAGRFAFDSLLPGDHVLEVRTSSLDSVRALQRLAITIASGSPPLAIRVPSAQDVAFAMCGVGESGSVERRKGVIIGTVDLTGDTSSVAGITVVADWVEGAKQEPRAIVRRTDAQGGFRLCGVPLDLPITLQASSETKESAPLELRVESHGQLALATMHLDSLRRGTAVLTGVVVDSADQPIAGVEVGFPSLRKTLVTDETGAFRLREIPAGPQQFLVRKIGWGPLDTIIEFSPRRITNQRIVLTRMTVLEAMQTTAQGAWLRDFEDNRRMGLGHFITEADIERERPVQTSQLFATMPGLQLIRDARTSRTYVVSSRGPTSISTARCGAGRPADVYLDNVHIYSGRPGEPPFDINSLDPNDIGGVEYYPGPSETPMRYQNLNAVCGVLVIWTRRDR